MRKPHPFKQVSGSAVLIATLAMGLGSASPPLLADNAGAFLGGMLASRVLHNMSERTEAEQVQAAAAVNQSQAAPRQSSSEASSVEERIHTLDQLRANGTISKSDYESRKKAILDSI